MKNIICLLCGSALFAGCASGPGTVSNSSDSRGIGYAEGPRVEGERPPEAGLDDKHWMLKEHGQQPGPEYVTRARSEESPAGTFSATEQNTAIGSGTGQLEIVDHADIELRKEELVVGKKEVSNGGVLVRTVVQSDKVCQPIDLRREEYVIERIPAGDARLSGSSGIAAFQGREIYIPLLREEPVVGKRVLLTEIVRIGKRIETDHEVVTQPVRSEDVQVVKNPDLANPRFANVPRGAAPGQGQVVAPNVANPAVIPGGDTLRLEKEEMVVGKRDVDNGGVYLQKVVRTQDASQPVDLRREEFNIDRQPANQIVDNADFTPREVRIDLLRERPVVGTRNFVTETVRIRKQNQQDNQTVCEVVRRENVEIVKNGGRLEPGQGGIGNASQTGTGASSQPEPAR